MAGLGDAVDQEYQEHREKVCAMLRRGIRNIRRGKEGIRINGINKNSELSFIGSSSSSCATPADEKKEDEEGDVKKIIIDTVVLKVPQHKDEVIKTQVIHNFSLRERIEVCQSFSYIEERKTYHFKVMQVITPHEFYLELASATLNPVFPNGEGDPMTENKPKFFTDMQVYYSDSRVMQMCRVRGDPSTSRMYASCCDPHQQWERVVILQKDENNRQVTVFLVDSGRTIRRLKYENLYELNKEFAAPPLEAIKCYLVGVEPPGADGDLHASWPTDSNERFREIVMNRRVSAFIRGKEIESLVDDNDLINQCNLGVVLHLLKDESVPSPGPPHPKESVQQTLIREDLADMQNDPVIWNERDFGEFGFE